MKKLVSCLAVAGLMMLGSSAIADLCTIEATPAATLLLPYFEVNIDDPSGIDTFFSINNASAAAALTHVIVWTDLSVEALDFNVYLTGYDVQTVGLGLIIRDGILPRTAAVNTVSPRGPYSGPHGSYSACAGILPYTNPALDEDFLNHLQSILTGGPSSIYNGRCGGLDYGDGIARGYVTVDLVNNCTLLRPCEEGYFWTAAGPSTGVGEYDNILWGDWYMIDYANNFAQGDTLVHVEAVDPADVVGQAFLNGTFWGRCVAGGAPFPPIGDIWYDNREPLGTTFASRFYQNAAFDGGTDLLVWRDSIIQYAVADGYYDQAAEGFQCYIGTPFWYPLPQRQTVVFDEQENPETVCTISPCPEADILFPAEAQRVSIPDLDVVPESGWIYMNLNLPGVCPFGGDCTYLGQNWVTAVHSAAGRFSAGLSAIQLDNMCDVTSITIGPYGDYPQQDEYIFNYFTYVSYFYYGAPRTEAGVRGQGGELRFRGPAN